MLTLSIVSHGQAALVRDLLEDVNARVRTPVSVLMTVNVPETLPFSAADFRFPIEIIRNPAPKGFGANHNAAFTRASGTHFCVLNPDIRLTADPFPPLLAALADPALGVAGPLVRNASGEVEPSFRRYPTPAFILRKALFGASAAPEYAIGDAPVSPDWIGGMFMLFRSETYREINGFDERYFLYYEDVDICARLRHRGYDVRLIPVASVVHAARRHSHRRPRYLAWHLRSMLRFWRSEAYRRVRRG
jgi:GT2 family glycosyltransferase